MYKFYSDPGHGWLQVPLPEIFELGIEKKISSYSYLHAGQAYLEEDSDFGVFYSAYKEAHGSAPKIHHDEKQWSESSPIRKMLRFPRFGG